MVAGYGDGTTYLASFGNPSGEISVTTGACNRDPAFDPATYNFSASEGAFVGDAVGTVSATDPDTSDTVTYSITAGNGDGKFAIDGSTGEVTMAAALDYETVSSYTLTVEASDGNGGTAIAAVNISLLLAECSNRVVVPRPDLDPELARDCSLLLSAKDKLAGGASLNWSADLIITRWEGVTIRLSPSPRVRHLLLDDLGLTGRIPPELGGLEGLERLDLEANYLTGEIPSELGRLSNLTELFLHFNRLTGGIPPELGSLSVSMIRTYIPPRQVGDGPWTPWYADYYHRWV